MTLEMYCKRRTRELLEQLDDAINDHAHTAYLETEARLCEVARMRHLIVDVGSLKDGSHG